MLTQGHSLALDHQNNCGRETQAKIKKTISRGGKMGLDF